MRHLLFIVAAVATTNLSAESLSDCHKKCYDAKHACNSKRGHTFNPCDHELFTCKASCNSGLKQANYSSAMPLDVSFKPIVDIELLKVFK